VSSVEAYLDQVCTRLRVHPAEADDIREELRAHLEERLHEAVTQGAGLVEAEERVLAAFGEAEVVRASLQSVHERAPWWLYRLLAGIAGALLGTASVLLLSLVQHAGVGALALPTPAEGAAAGAAAGMLCWPGRGIAVATITGALAWVSLSYLSRISGTRRSAALPLDWLCAFASVVFSPVAGALFGATVATATATLLSMSSRLRLRTG
jgi:hypothetical protein